ncbi:MAG: hypothetical protein ABSE82_09310 [Nitrososphaerales archaeon]|jgi:hypothetical protein
MLGMPIGGMQFNDDPSGKDTAISTNSPKTKFLNGIPVNEHSGEVPQFVAQSELGHPVTEIQAMSIGERLVQAKYHAFVTLAVVFGCSQTSIER